MSRKNDNKLFDKEDHLQTNPILRFFGRLLDRRILGQLESLIDKAKDYGLPQADIDNALINIEYYEYEVAFDLIIEQMYEYNIKIDQEFYEQVIEICKTLKIDSHKYTFVSELIRK